LTPVGVLPSEKRAGCSDVSDLDDTSSDLLNEQITSKLAKFKSAAFHSFIMTKFPNLHKIVFLLPFALVDKFSQGKTGAR